MNKSLTVLMLVGACAQAETLLETFGGGANQFQVEFVTIGNPGNTADTLGDPNPVGAVDYVYKIAKYEVSRDMITKANALGNMGISLGDMSGYAITTDPNGPNRPASLISWNEAARFVNWLNTSKGYQAAYNFTTSGHNDYITLWEPGQYNGTNRFRHKDAYFFLPSVDEWYKAAFGSPSGTWFQYANGTNNPPEAVAEGTSGAVYGGQSGPANIENAGSLSAYGTMAQGGNVWEWTETAYDGGNDTAGEYTELRGGSVNDPLINVSNTARHGGFNPSSQHFNLGFRVASVPEPSSLSLLLAGGAVLMACKRRGFRNE